MTQRYADFIADVQNLAHEGQALLDSGAWSHTDPAFRRWRYTTESLVENVRQQGFQLPGKFNSKNRRYRATWVGAVRADEKEIFRSELADSLVELNFFIQHFEKYGELPAPAQSLKPIEESNPNPRPKVAEQQVEKVTLAWLWKHVPVGLWLGMILFCGTIFSLGFVAGKSAFFTKAASLVSETFQDSPQKGAKP